MPFGAHIVTLVEDALSECFKYHNQLDNFLVRAGLTRESLAKCRDRAEMHNKRSGRFQVAPKRIVVQQVLLDINTGKSDDDRLIGSIITALRKGTFPDATPIAQAACAKLAEIADLERKEAAENRQAHLDQLRAKEKEREKEWAEKRAKRAQFQKEFLGLCSLTDPHQRGYALERFLNDFLDFEGLSPRKSFRIVGEQIDGSFLWSGRTYLVEAKWVKQPVGAASFSSLMYKIEGKTADTRGLFISINGYSDDAIKGLQQKGELRFACIDGSHLMRCLQDGETFPHLFEVIWRHASETGDAYLPVASEQFLSRTSQS